MFKVAATRVVTSSPAKLIFCGEHFVIYGAPALATSLKLRTYCTVERIDVDDEKEAQIELQMPDIKAECRVKWKELLELPEKTAGEDPASCKQAHWDQLPSSLDLALLSRLSTLLGEDKSKISIFYLLLKLSSGLPHASRLRLSLRIHISSDFPVGAGLGSSAAFHVSFVGALFRYFSYLRDADLVPPPLSYGSAQHQSGKRDATPHARSALLQPSESMQHHINRWAFLAEHIMHASPSGIDNTICTFGRAISFRLRQGERCTVPSIMTPLNILIVNTKVPRSTKDMVTRVAELNRQSPQLMASHTRQAGQVTCRILELFALHESDDGARLATLENSLGPLLGQAHAILDAIGVGHERLTKVVDSAKKYGFYAKLTGAGGGGCAMVLIPSTAEQDAVDTLKQDLAQEAFDYFETVIGDVGLTYHEN